MASKTAIHAWDVKVVGWDMVPPEDLLANPANFRRHPAKQREALRGSLNELGIIAPVIQNVLTGHLLDGHARVEEYPEQTGRACYGMEIEPKYVAVALERLAGMGLEPTLT